MSGYPRAAVSLYRKPTLRLLSLLAMFLWPGCAGTDSSGTDQVPYSGMYVLTRVDGQPLPVAVATPLFSGNITSGGLDIDRDANYWLRLNVFAAGAGTRQYQGRGAAIPGSGAGISFVDRDGALQWTATKIDTLLTIPDLLGVSAQFRWVGPYRRPQ